MSSHFSHLPSFFLFLGMIAVFIVAINYLDVFLGKILDIVKPVGESEKSAEEILSFDNYNKEREKSKGKEGEMFYSQKGF